MSISDPRFMGNQDIVGSDMIEVKPMYRLGRMFPLYPWPVWKSTKREVLNPKTPPRAGADTEFQKKGGGGVVPGNC